MNTFSVRLADFVKRWSLQPPAMPRTTSGQRYDMQSGFEADK